MSESRPDLRAADAFGLLSDETRVDIVRALGDNRNRNPTQRQVVFWGEDRPNRLSYSALKDSVGVEDNGRMNYHLNELQGVFLQSVRDGYQLTNLGYMAYRYLIAGTFEWSDSWTVELDGGEATENDDVDNQSENQDQDLTCSRCGSPYVVDYGPYQFLRVGCQSCEEYYVGVHYPARGVADRPIEEVVRAADRKMRAEYALMRNEVCHWCGGRVERSLDLHQDAADRIAGPPAVVTYSCLTCGNVRYNSVAGDLLAHPAVLSFYATHGRSLWEIRTWQVSFLDGEHVTLTSREPLQVVVSVTLDGDTLHVTVEEDGRVSGIDRTHE